MMTDERSSTLMEELFRADDDSGEVFLDLDSFWSLMGGLPDSSQEGPQDFSQIEVSPDLYPDQSIKVDDFETSAVHIEESAAIAGDRSSQDASHTEWSTPELPGTDTPDLQSESSDLYYLHSENPYAAPSEWALPFSYEFNKLSSNDHGMTNIMDGGGNPICDPFGTRTFEDIALDNFGPLNSNFGRGNCVSSSDGFPITNSFDITMEDSASKQHSTSNLSNICGKMQYHVKHKRNGEYIAASNAASSVPQVSNDVFSRKFGSVANTSSACDSMKWSFLTSAAPSSDKKYALPIKNENGELSSESKRPRISPHGVDAFLKNSYTVAHNHKLDVRQSLNMLSSASIKKQFSFPEIERDALELNGSYLSNISNKGAEQSLNPSCDVDDDPDVCVLEDMSAPPRPNRSAPGVKSLVASQISTSRDSRSHVSSGHSKFKLNDERFIFRVALQDLSQPKSEATPPDGVLAIPLLKHQRIALSWMVNKETSGAFCSGGILADDQGLGKTISTIALILKERSPSSKASMTNEELCQTVTLNLDEDDDVSDLYQSKQESKPPQLNGGPTVGGSTHIQANGRPAAGTLIVCPTSVLRQWSDELRNKVSKKADLSVLVYHGGNRTKDIHELAKYDVVITTYAIVSMEVPKQPVVNEDDDEIGTPFKGFSLSKKRQLLENMTKKKYSKSKKNKKGISSELLEATSGPLAKVGWFRVVLDEAQSIKNHRTLTARACWGLRAKRRWCLSGTPIQNAVDDLYSYFRFLRYDPYARFQYFCSQLKTPIHKNPKVGYKKLQAVLKTIMLRRTKGTVIDGEPIINLPPKTIKLKKVDFSKEERDYYCKLEADSRAQYAEYAAAGTVKQNYVNILLMLLRLRQACDHPCLVNGFSSNSKMTSSIEMVKKLPQETQNFLLNCLQASLAICGICKDPPEDAIVTICGHVFCNQCISEHLTGDDTQCPSKSCKTHLKLSSIFSVTTLRIALSNQLTMENTSESIPELGEFSGSCSLKHPYGSSKIRAAVKYLMSLSKQSNGASGTNLSGYSEMGYYSGNLLSHDSGEGNKSSDMIVSLDNSSKVLGDKAIVFSQWTGMLDLLESCLKESSIQYRRLDGTMSVLARDRAVKDFNTLPEVSVMIMSLKAASLGLNMVAACHVLLLDLWWNPTTEDQAVDRAHRIGQTRPVTVLRLTVKDTVEDRILALQQKKREMVASAFGEDETGSRQTRLTVDDLNYLFNAD